MSQTTARSELSTHTRFQANIHKKIQRSPHFPAAVVTSLYRVSLSLLLCPCTCVAHAFLCCLFDSYKSESPVTIEICLTFLQSSVVISGGQVQRSCHYLPSSTFGTVAHIFNVMHPLKNRVREAEAFVTGEKSSCVGPHTPVSPVSCTALQGNECRRRTSASSTRSPAVPAGRPRPMRLLFGQIVQEERRQIDDLFDRSFWRSIRQRTRRGSCLSTEHESGYDQPVEIPSE